MYGCDILGIRFALMEVKLILASVLSEFRMLETNNTPKILEIDPAKMNILSVKGDPMVKVEKHNMEKH